MARGGGLPGNMEAPLPTRLHRLQPKRWRSIQKSLTSATKSVTTTKQDSRSVKKKKTVTISTMTYVEMTWSIGEQTLDIDFTVDVTSLFMPQDEVVQ